MLRGCLDIDPAERFKLPPAAERMEMPSVTQGDEAW